MVQSHFDILQQLMAGELTMTKLADQVSRTKPTVTTLVKRLKKHGYVKVYKAMEDKRITKVRLTEKGLAQAEWARKTLNAYEASIIDLVDVHKMEEAIILMEKITDILENLDVGYKAV